LSLTLVPLAAQHLQVDLLAEFDIGKPALNEWLLRHAAQAQASGSARTFVALDGQRVAGYFSLTVGQVDRHVDRQVNSADVTERPRKGMGSDPIPVVILARLAVSVQEQGRGIGTGLLQDAIVRTLQLAEIAGVRALLTQPINEEAASFYRRFGFEAPPIREQQLLLLLKDARKVAALRHPVPSAPRRFGP
jgi:GNAT superfamily N-acetyltransferase